MAPSGWGSHSAISIESENAQTFNLVILLLGNQLSNSNVLPMADHCSAVPLFVIAKDWK